jgi:gliding motility-associated-like protein
MTEIYFTVRLIVSSFLLLLFSFSANAQLQAGFTTDKAGGCSPLTIAFTNTTTGASANAIYKWDLGNSNTSALPNAAATYIQEQTYSVTLTVTDAGKSSSVTRQISVYKRPTVDFSFDTKKGCLPLSVNFTASATPGDGTIANYFWDFGDGNTLQTPAAQIQHTYNLSQNTSVGLTVMNSFGCYTAIEKNATQVLPAIQAAFNTDNKVLCKITDPVVFINNSTGPGVLSYAWDFGDGNTSTATTPSHVYNLKGTYTIKLTVSNTDGCANTNTQLNYINANNYAADFDVPPLICASNQVTFTDKSVPVANSSIWLVDNNYTCYWCPVNLFYTFDDTLAHSIRLINTYGGCMDTVTKQVIPKALPDIKPFVVNIPIHCNVPVAMNFKDTTKDVTRWLWNFNWSNDQPSSTLQNPTYNFTDPYGHLVKLTVTNAAGCSAYEGRYVYPGPPNVSIGVINTDYTSACDSVHVMFMAYTTDSIVTYNWDFTDGNYSTLAQPAHTFNKEGDFFVKLSYVTVSGCTGNVVFDRVHVSKRHPFDFTASGTTICGNTPVSFHLTSGTDYNRWNFGDGFVDESEWNYNTTHQYQLDSTYTVSVIISDYYGFCPDTLIKKDYIKVLAPFPRILSAQNTCDGLRNVITFKDTSYKATGWEWDFGDGSSHFTSNTSQVITHAYATTGAYKVVLTNTNAQCSVRDSTKVYVLFKQHPILTSNVTSTCGSDISFLHLNNMETNPAPDPYFWYGNYYGLDALQYGDSSNYIGYPSQNGAWQNIADWTLTRLDPSKKDLRIISNSAYFDCKDTTNFIPLKINGVKAGFKIIESSPCFAYPVILQDTSKAMSSSIKKWEWTFGDGSTASENKGGITYHTYATPGEYLVQLKVTDSLGCTDNTINYYNDFTFHYARPSGPKAGFIFSPANVTPNSPVTFINNSNTFTANTGDIEYLWLFGDGSTSTDFEPPHSFAATGVYTVKLIASNTLSLCKDTFTQVINVKLINTQFSFTKSYVSTSTCPPVIVHFTNTSSNAQSVAWDFGDGSIADNQNNPSHTYYTPGTYKITMYGFGYNGTRDTTVDSIVVRAPFATLKADKLSGCLSQNITLNAVVTNASYITWDFADGTIKQTQDTFAVHQYTTPGLYNPSLILLDSGGCYLTAKLADTIIIDALTVTLPNNKHYCDAASVFFDPTVTSVAAAAYNQPLTYHWNFGTGKLADTANILRPTFNYSNPGRYFVSLQVQSPYGCVKLATDSIIVAKGSAASITGPYDICQGGNAIFTGQATNHIPGITWKWDLGNGTAASQQNPPPIVFADSGNFRIFLVVINDGCADTAMHPLTVHSNPVIHASPQQADLCLGNSISLHAGGGISYSWSPATGLDNSSTANPVASPLFSTRYLVKVIDVFGCSNTDSVNIKVAQPFSIQVSGDKDICAGSSVALQATGAITYTWINNIAGLSNTQIGNPVATPASTIQYTVVGYDANHCFTDTAAIYIRVNPLPVINHQPDVETLGGIPVQLRVSGSTNIISWSWQPGNYLSCNDCAAPICTPLRAVTYIATGTTQYGCTVSDTIMVKLTCAISHIFVPSVFSPNNDGVNDVFTIQGTGVRSIKWMRIFNRWGEIVFEKTNSLVGDRSAGWDGMVKDAPASPGTYIYMAELTCDSGEVFPLKGTVILIK